MVSLHGLEGLGFRDLRFGGLGCLGPMGLERRV